MCAGNITLRPISSHKKKIIGTPAASIWLKDVDVTVRYLTIDVLHANERSLCEYNFTLCEHASTKYSLASVFI
jgi:hypothetical protein